MNEGSAQQTVLIVEDEGSLLDLYTTWLETEGYKIRTASTGNEAMSLIESDADLGLDAAILDRRLPDYSGDKILEKIREEGIDCGVAMVTAVDPDYDILEMGFDKYAKKPIDKEELVSIVAVFQVRETYSLWGVHGPL